MIRDQELVRELFGFVRRSPMVTREENLLLVRAAKRLDELVRARALRWADAVKRGYYGQPAYITGYVDEYGLEIDSWALLYSDHCDLKDDLHAIVNVDKMWTIRPDQNEVIFWSNVPTAEQITQELGRRGIETVPQGSAAGAE